MQFALVNVLSKRVNRLSNGRQLFPVERVNFFRMDRQMLKTRVERSQPYSGKDNIEHFLNRNLKEERRKNKRFAICENSYIYILYNYIIYIYKVDTTLLFLFFLLSSFIFQ